MDFRVDLETFRGPLDLLLYLVRKHEVEIVDIPISTITDQYLKYLTVLEQLDVDSVGDFLAMASWLMAKKPSNHHSQSRPIGPSDLNTSPQRGGFTCRRPLLMVR